MLNSHIYDYAVPCLVKKCGCSFLAEEGIQVIYCNSKDCSLRSDDQPSKSLGKTGVDKPGEV